VLSVESVSARSVTGPEALVSVTMRDSTAGDAAIDTSPIASATSPGTPHSRSAK